MASLPLNLSDASAPRREFLPFALPDVTEREIEAVTRVLRSGWITTGPEVQAFEREFAAAIGVGYAVALNSCTAALHLGLEALGVRAGDEVLTSTLTFTATAEVVEYLGARTRLLDVERDTLNLSPGTVRAFVDREYRRSNGQWTHRQSGGVLKAILPVHFGGHLCDMPGFIALGEELGVRILDDAAHALPASLNGRSVGAFGCPTAFSFYATKTITTGEGGMLTTDDAAVADRVRMMGLHGISRDAWKRYSAEGSWRYEVVEAGYKYNMTDIAAAMGRVQLLRAEELREKRSAIASAYQSGLSGLESLDLPVVRPGAEHAWHLFPVRLNLARLRIDRGQFIEALRRRNIGTSVHFIPLHLQPFYRDKYGYRPEAFPVAGEEYLTVVSLPIYSSMSEADVKDVVGAVADVASQSAA